MHCYSLLATRVLIQDAETGDFLKLLRGWTRNPREAFDFQTTANAMEFCREGRLVGVHLILHTEHGNNVVVAHDSVMQNPSADFASSTVTA